MPYDNQARVGRSRITGEPIVIFNGMWVCRARNETWAIRLSEALNSLLDGAGKVPVCTRCGAVMRRNGHGRNFRCGHCQEQG